MRPVQGAGRAVRPKSAGPAQHARGTNLCEVWRGLYREALAEAGVLWGCLQAGGVQGAVQEERGMRAKLGDALLLILLMAGPFGLVVTLAFAFGKGELVDKPPLQPEMPGIEVPLPIACVKPTYEPGKVPIELVVLPLECYDFVDIK